VQLELTAMPPLMGLYARGLVFGRKAFPRGGTVPRIAPIAAHLPAAKVDPAALRRYADVCGFAAGPNLPLTYPHVLATPLHAALVMRDSFPYPVLGVVHVRQRIDALRAIPASARLDLHVALVGEREARRGVEFDTLTEVRVDGELVWSSVATALVQGGRKPRERSDGRRPPQVDGDDGLREPERTEEPWVVPEAMGRRYARVTGDYNPIHLYAASARLFGFPRAIVHGMWSLARCVAAIDAEGLGPALTLEAAFRRPVLLPSKVTFGATPRRTGEGVAFALRDAQGVRDHLHGTLSPLHRD
jgi:acyl dehydratase